MTAQDQPTATTVETGDVYWTDFPNIIRLTGEETDGALCAIEMRLPPGYEGPPHVHEREDETFHVVEGEVVLTIGDETTVADAGTIVHGPRGVPHGHANESDDEAVIITWVHPAGFEEFMARAAPKVTDPDDPPVLDMERVLELAPAYGVEFLLPEESA
ncbi:MAG: cupin domain-containing protein [Halobacteriota archaeon]